MMKQIFLEKVLHTKIYMDLEDHQVLLEEDHQVLEEEDRQVLEEEDYQALEEEEQALEEDR
jgi:hypothetical protein